MAKRAKDIAASAVLVTALNALLVGYIIFEKKITFQLRSAFYIYLKAHISIRHYLFLSL
ncbi:MAG: diacylglycerol kinase [Fusobacterium varium]|uniref:diacylglycerol kinase n=1 Tax=Fusobacterium varium TaxID=856 RepID=UPI00242F9D14|nr:diacylglycerol kinase [Fusobacterium varium]UYI77943.1 MAG: diacylglycerol kinase [Fusobacterium varium]